jgi:uncharacterized protein YfdQ (DUF2303 family)
MNYRDEDTNGGEIDSAILAGMAIGDVKDLTDKLKAIVLPSGAKLEQIDLQAFENKYAMVPRRATGVRELATAASFIAYVNAFKAVPATTIYASKERVRFDAVLNGNADARTPGHGDFSAIYNCPLSVEWKRWNARSQHNVEQKKGMTQAEFMVFLEDNLLDITAPDSAALLMSVRSFEAHSEAKFKNAVNLDNGSVEFRFTETINEVAQDGKLSLPTMFEITIPVFDGGERYSLDARLRYRISGGGLVLWYELVRPHKTLEFVFNEVRSQIQAGVSDVPVYDV